VIKPVVSGNSKAKVTGRRLSDAGARFRQLAENLGAPEEAPFSLGTSNQSLVSPRERLAVDILLVETLKQLRIHPDAERWLSL
jgi:hypothetical protein